MFWAGSKDPQNSFLPLPFKLPTQPLEVTSAFCPFHGCKVTAVLMFISLITSELEPLFSYLSPLFWWIYCLLYVDLNIYLYILSTYESFIDFISFLVGFRHCKYLWSSFSSWKMPCSSGFGAFVLAVLSAFYIYLPDTCKQGSLDI